MNRIWKWFFCRIRRARPAAALDEPAPFIPFLVPTPNETKVPSKVLPVDPGDASTGVPFEIHDPFGLRRAVVPVFTTEEKGPRGIGTAFLVDGWNTYLTADHVVDFIREANDPRQLHPGRPIPFLTPDAMPPAFVLLSPGVAFGTVTLPESDFAPVVGISGVLAAQGNPMKELRGFGPDQPLADIATLHVLPHPQAPSSASLLLRMRDWTPVVGETVLAVGFPGMLFSDHDHGRNVVRYEEDMVGVYGTIIEVFPDGRGQADQSPGFSVAADWAPGMSGGPVINSAGEVVGLVSRSVQPDEEGDGVGYAMWFAGNDLVERVLSHLDPDEPGWRRGYALIAKEEGEDPGEIMFVPTYATAHAVAKSSSGPTTIHVAQHRLGTTEMRFQAEEATPTELPTQHFLTEMVITSRGTE